MTIQVLDGNGALQTIDTIDDLLAYLAASQSILGAGTSGGWTPSWTISAASTNATSLKGSAGQVAGIQAYNFATSIRYLKLYNKASAPTVGTDVPVLVIPIPPASAAGQMGGVVLQLAIGLAFSTGIAWALTTGLANTDTGAVSANDCGINIDWK